MGAAAGAGSEGCWGVTWLGCVEALGNVLDNPRAFAVGAYATQRPPVLRIIKHIAWLRQRLVPTQRF
jgi:hypothetical protein